MSGPCESLPSRAERTGYAVGKVDAAGGKLIKGPAGGYALVSDPAGATFAIYQPGEFAGALFPYETEPVPGGIDYAVYKAGGEPVCGRPPSGRGGFFSLRRPRG